MFLGIVGHWFCDCTALLFYCPHTSLGFLVFIFLLLLLSLLLFLPPLFHTLFFFALFLVFWFWLFLMDRTKQNNRHNGHSSYYVKLSFRLKSTKISTIYREFGWIICFGDYQLLGLTSTVLSEFYLVYHCKQAYCGRVWRYSLIKLHESIVHTNNIIFLFFYDFQVWNWSSWLTVPASCVWLTYCLPGRSRTIWSLFIMTSISSSCMSGFACAVYFIKIHIHYLLQEKAINVFCLPFNILFNRKLS